MLGVLVLLTSVALWGNEWLLPSVSAILYLFLILEFIRERRRIKSAGRNIIFLEKGKVKTLIIRIALLVLGLVCIVSGVIIPGKYWVFKGVDFVAFAGLALFLAGLLRNKKYSFLAGPQSLVLNDEKGWAEINYPEIEKFVMGDNLIEISTAKERRVVLLSENQNSLPELFDFLKSRLGEKLSV